MLHDFVEEDPLLIQVNDQLRLSRNLLPPQTPAVPAQRNVYPAGVMPLGIPGAVNPEVMAPAVRHNPQGMIAAPWTVERVVKD